MQFRSILPYRAGRLFTRFTAAHQCVQHQCAAKLAKCLGSNNCVGAYAAALPTMEPDQESRGATLRELLACGRENGCPTFDGKNALFLCWSSALRMTPSSVFSAPGRGCHFLFGGRAALKLVLTLVGAFGHHRCTPRRRLQRFPAFRRCQSVLGRKMCCWVQHAGMLCAPDCLVPRHSAAPGLYPGSCRLRQLGGQLNNVNTHSWSHRPTDHRCPVTKYCHSAIRNTWGDRVSRLLG